MSKRRKIIIFLICIFILVAIWVIVVYPSIYEDYCKNKTDDEMTSKLQTVCDANIGIIECNDEDGIKGYGTGACGVIFLREDNKYYALTAYHVIKENVEYLIQTTNSGTLSEYARAHQIPLTSAITDYYNAKPKATVEYIDEESDLAIISFTCDEDLSVIPISSEFPSKNDKVMVVGNLDGVFFHTTYGKILSDKTIVFATDDGQSDNVVLQHTAYVTHGSSGGAVINDETTLIGINIGGTTDALGRFKYGVMIPCDQIEQVIDKWRENNAIY